MALNAWQKLTRVLPGKPFGDGIDGAYSSATIPTMTYESCSGTSGTKSLTTVGTTLSNGDIVLLHQTMGTGAGQWEINRVASGGGTSSITLQENLQYTYTDSGASQAQAIVIPQYTNVTSSGTWSPTDWGGNTGGIFAFAATGDVSIGGTIELNGGAGASSTGTPAGGTGGGFRGGAAENANPTDSAVQGESAVGAGAANNSSANGAGGGAVTGTGASTGAGGGGGGHAASGTSGSAGSSRTPGTGGGTDGAAELTDMVFGGGGGGGGDDGGGADTVGGGGSGGGIIVIFAKNISGIPGAVRVNGGAGGAGSAEGGGGGGGAGGSVLIQCATATLGTNKITASAGSASQKGGAGSVGRIAVHHSGTVTGSTSPTFNDTTDGTLIESNPALLFNFI